MGNSGRLERAELANQIQGFRILDRWDASEKNKQRYYTLKRLIRYIYYNLFLQIGLWSTLIRHENRTFLKFFENTGFFVFGWRENILETDLFEITGFLGPCFLQAYIRNKRWLLHFSQCERKTFDALSEWNLRLQIPLGNVVRAWTYKSRTRWKCVCKLLVNW